MTLLALSRPQPYASLIALGVQHVVPLPWSTEHRGWVAIYATKQRPETWDFEDGCDFGQVGAMQYAYDREQRWWHYYVYGGEHVGHEGPFDLPLGAIVGTARLVDVVPIYAIEDRLPVAYQRHISETYHGELRLWNGRTDHDGPMGRPTWLHEDIEDQRPYGDFTPGNFAWLFEDAAPVEKRCPGCIADGRLWFLDDEGSWVPVPTDDPSSCPTCDGKGSCDPIPAKGRARLWRWEG